MFLAVSARGILTALPRDRTLIESPEDCRHAQSSPIPAFTDNYIWCLHDGRSAWVVDPGDAAPVIAFIEARRLHLHGILITHHHGDHIGGVAALRNHFRSR